MRKRDIIPGTRTPHGVINSVRGMRRLWCERCGMDLPETGRPSTRLCTDCQGSPEAKFYKKGKK